MRKLILAASILMLIPGVAYAGGGGVDTTGCAGYREGTSIGMQDSCFSGTAHFAPSGTTITVSNDGQLPHTLTAVDGSFDTGMVDGDSSAELTIDEPGVYRVFCELHGTPEGEGMAGVLVVGEATPPAMALPADNSEITETMAAETAKVMEAIESQGTAIQDLNAADARLLAAVNEMDGTGAEALPPQVITVEDEVAPVQLVVLLVVGLAAGIALAALLTVLRLRIADSSASKPGRLRPTAES